MYAVILGYIATLMIYLGTGPNWYNVVMASEGCRVTWWKQFLYSEWSNLRILSENKIYNVISYSVNNLFPGDMNSQVNQIR